jgi:hypothetical protein
MGFVVSSLWDLIVIKKVLQGRHTITHDDSHGKNTDFSPTTEVVVFVVSSLWDLVVIKKVLQGRHTITHDDSRGENTDFNLAQQTKP